VKTPAVAEAVDSDSDAVAAEMQWDWDQDNITMHPFWAVRRMTAKQLAVAREQAAGRKVPEKLLPRFNCEMAVQTVSCVTVGIVKSSSCGSSRTWEVQFLTNNLEVEEGEELIMESHIREKPTPEPTKRGWKTALRESTKSKEAEDRTQTKANIKCQKKTGEGPVFGNAQQSRFVRR